MEPNRPDRTRGELLGDDAAALAYDRVCDRAWSLALLVTGDEACAADAIVAVFAARSRGVGTDWSDDARLLRDVRLQALADAPKPVRSRSEFSAELAAMSPRQREAMELSMVGRCTPTQIARALGTVPSEVTAQLAAGFQLLANSMRSGGVYLKV